MAIGQAGVDGEGDSGFVAIGEPDRADADDRVSREDRHAVVAALEWHEPSEGGVHFKLVGEDGGLVNVVAAIGTQINFLEGDKVGVLLAQDTCDAIEIDAVVGALPVTDVIGHGIDGCSVWLRGAGLEDGEQGCVV